MTGDPLTLDDLARGLERHGDRYGAIAVFADDVGEIAALGAGAPPDALRPLSPDRHRIELGGRAYLLEVRRAGSVRLVRAVAGFWDPVPVEPGEVRDQAAHAVARAVERKGHGFAKGLVLGLLTGAPLRPEDPPGAPHRVFPLRFDPETRAWRAYDGGLLRWMKEQLTNGDRIYPPNPLS